MKITKSYVDFWDGPGLLISLDFLRFLQIFSDFLQISKNFYRIPLDSIDFLLLSTDFIGFSADCHRFSLPKSRKHETVSRGEQGRAGESRRESRRERER